ncbi:hypothetical protein ACI2IX_11055 [Leifsonia aquatica]|uniref:hypothetical protein n=1 Tax=Leifsonia aquatica TaxID=144185 RepID=UPI00384D4E6D
MISVFSTGEADFASVWARHYRDVGARQFHVALHALPGPEEPALTAIAVEHLGEAGIQPALVDVSPWDEGTNGRLRDVLSECCSANWHLLSDADELHAFELPLAEEVRRLERDGSLALRGLFLDRIAAHGELDANTPLCRLLEQHVVGVQLTRNVALGDPRKVSLRRAGVRVSEGNHRTPDVRADSRFPTCVHHFKWRGDILSRLRRRVEQFGSGAWAEQIPAIRREAERVLEFEGLHGGAVEVANPLLEAMHVSGSSYPQGWGSFAQPRIDQWRPVGVGTR